jgi:tRNA-specific 2-thiouridylase
MAKVVVGLSGGVDSAVAAYLLKKQGYEVIGAFMRNWDALANNDVLGNPTINNDICPQEQDYNDALIVAKQLDIPLLRVDFVKEYWDHVFTYFIDEYNKGRTPNPDILCNKYIKFDAFAKFALTQGADYIATGHYARIVHEGDKHTMLKGIDENKDQTYFLCQLNKKQLSNVLFPVGDLTKVEVRKIAKELDLKVATKKDSTGICFIGERNFKEFLKNYIPSRKGKIVDIATNEVLGTHDGVMYYTLGQRKGLGIGGIANHETGSWFVVSKDIDKSILYVAQGDENDYLFKNRAIIKEVNWLDEVKNKDFRFLNAKFRYRQKDIPIKMRFIDDTTVEVIALDMVKAITEGQSCVFYDGDICLGGGVIDEVSKV